MRGRPSPASSIEVTLAADPDAKSTPNTMNYRHAFHAGNFADVLKHAVLAAVISHLKRKPQPFRVIDTHAGAGLYDLAGDEAERTGEWREGIGRILADAAPPADVAAVLAPYLDVVRGENPDWQSGASLTRYPGSPLIARRLMRPGDKLVANEPHPEDGARLKALFARDASAKVLALDGWMALKSLLPPPERRGVVLIDPPFEQAGEFHRLTAALVEAHRRFATGTVILWFPVKDARRVTAFHREVETLGIPKLLASELYVRAPLSEGTLAGTGLVVLNPPFTLEAALQTLLPYFTQKLGRAKSAGHQLTWIAGESIKSS